VDGSGGVGVDGGQSLRGPPPDLAELWQTGQVSTEVVAAIARGLRGVTAEVESKFLAAVVTQLPVLSLAGVKLLVAQTLDHLHPG
jgi:hypothetical protein